MFTHEMIKSFNQLEMDVYNYIISNEEKVVYMKVRELAEEVHVSTTTILRFCKKVGCEGYSEFRLKLKQEVNSKEQKKINMDLTAVKDFFERVQTQAFAENIQEAVKLLTKASSIIFVGVGNSSIIGKYGARYFNNVGWFSFAIDDPFTPVFRGKGERTATVALSVSGDCSPTEQAETKDYTQYVNTFIGAADNGHTFPGACYPFGMIQTSPVTGAVGWRYCSEYTYQDSLIWASLRLI